MSRDAINWIDPCNTNLRSLERFARTIKAMNINLVKQKLRSYYSLDSEGEVHDLQEIISIPMLEGNKVSAKIEDIILLDKNPIKCEMGQVSQPSRYLKLNNINFKAERVSIKNPFRDLLASRKDVSFTH